MIELKKFPKLGVRAPLSLKRKVKQLVLDMDTAGVAFNGDELSMEAAFGVAILELLSMSPADQERIFGRRIPELMAMFAAEAPDDRPAAPPPEAAPGRYEISKDRRVNKATYPSKKAREG